MDSKLPVFIKTIVVCLLAYALPMAQAIAAPNLQLNPTGITAVQNNNFQEKIMINVDTNNVLSSDAIVNYAGADLDVVSVTNGGFFPQFSFSNDPSGILEIHGYTTANNSTITGMGTLATIVFKAKKLRQ